MSDLGPCIVQIPEKIEYMRNRAYGSKIPCVVQEAEEHKGYFHRWSERYWAVGESPMVGGHSAGQMSATVGIVEYEDGTVHEVLPGQIQFTDR